MLLDYMWGILVGLDLLPSLRGTRGLCPTMILRDTAKQLTEAVTELTYLLKYLRTLGGGRFICRGSHKLAIS